MIVAVRVEVQSGDVFGQLWFEMFRGDPEEAGASMLVEHSMWLCL